MSRINNYQQNVSKLKPTNSKDIFELQLHNSIKQLFKTKYTI